ncbi:hypothetical protein [Rufibacter sp. XAAS-G3-1]|uniref:hypothetical protein n=1 Tax=Rufibacter sp. XAAS-G3-1 TaxID=2729134 RepID=UPI001C632AC4|nr:hypothetical protein [Rufibacter sp. XAAS-G3-1]
MDRLYKPLWLALVFTVSIGLSSCQLSRFIFYNFADITDDKSFPWRPLTRSAQPFTFRQATTPLPPLATAR